MADRRGFSPSARETPADVPRWTSGRESWVFRAETPDDRALALGWFVVHYAGSHGPASCPVLFGSRGNEHFHEIVRTWRRAGQDERVDGVTRLDWPDVWKGVPVYLRAEVQPLVDEGERPHAVLRTPETWTAEKRWWGHRPACASSPGLLVATSRGLLWATSEPRQKPDGLSFGVNVTIVRPELVRRAAIGGREGMRVLRVQAGDGPSGRELEVPFGDDLAAAEEVVRLAMAWSQRA